MQTIRFPAIALLIFALVTACSDAVDPPTAADLSTGRQDPERGRAGGVVVCHKPERGGQLLEVSTSALDAHLGHGDYLARYEVDPLGEEAATFGRYRRIWQALDAVRAGRVERGERTSAACRITIEVARGEYTGSFDAGASSSLERFPLLVDVPDVTLRGALEMEVDQNGRATGEARHPDGITSLRPDRPITFQPVTEAIVLVVGHPGGTAGNGAVIEGFAFGAAPTETNSGGMAIISLRVERLVVRGNRFDRGLSTAGDFRATSAVVIHNYGKGLGVNCGFCMAGPGDYLAEGNRLVDGALGGLYVTAALAHLPFSIGAIPGVVVEPYELPGSAAVTARVLNNEVQGHLRKPIGFGLRILALGPSSSSVPQSTRVVVADNEFSRNTFGLIVDAGFPQAGTLRRGDVDVALRGNSISQSCQANLLVAFTRHTGALGTTVNPYLASSTYRLDLGGDLPWAEAWYSHPDGYGNTLMVGGAGVPPGQRVAYDPAKSCP